jgi:inosine-uridine nucleoside N-ribohydrolase
MLRTAALALLLAHATAAAQSAGTPELLIYDNDWSAASAPSLLPLLAAPQWRVLGLTTVTGDTWRDQGKAELQAFLATAGAMRIPVVDGANAPLRNTRERMLAWEQQYGQIPWKGAWNNAAPPPTPASTLSAPKGAEAADFLVHQVRAHPHQVTIYAAGPLTNLAQALQRDPEFATLAKRLVFIGANLTQFKRDGSARSDFNLLFDPEAADMVLRAPWPDVTAIGDVTEDALLSPALRDRLAEKHSPAADHILHTSRPNATLWDTLGAVILVDPKVARQVLPVTMAVDLSGGPFQGRARAWSKGTGPAGARPVTVVRTIDIPRLDDDIVNSLP